jgi:hypothetical protein
MEGSYREAPEGRSIRPATPGGHIFCDEDSENDILDTLGVRLFDWSRNSFPIRDGLHFNL